MKMLLFNSFILSTSVLLSSCESPSNKSLGRNTNNGTQVGISQNGDGYYVGDIFPLNHNLHFKNLGVIGVEKSGDNFNVKVKMTNAPKDATIRHDLYAATSCPTIEADLNKDAYIDINEARIALGQVVVPFDGDLSSQLSGNFTQSYSDASGNYTYSNSTSFDLMLSELKATDSSIPPYMMKLAAEDQLKIWGRVVLFHGINNRIELPGTVSNDASSGSVNESLPMGCAVLWSAASMPEELL